MKNLVFVRDSDLSSNLTLILKFQELHELSDQNEDFTISLVS